MQVLSLFDGIACGRLALERLGCTDITYDASEIDEYAIRAARARFGDIIPIGDVRAVSYGAGVLRAAAAEYEIDEIDLLIAGSPCQGLSRCNAAQLGLADPRSALYFEFERLLREAAPRWWLFENVRVKPDVEALISERLGCAPIKLNSSCVSAQDRLRYYWTNIPFDAAALVPRAPLTLRQLIGPSYLGVHVYARGKMRGGVMEGREKSYCVTTSAWEYNYKVALTDGTVRRLTAEEVEQLQTLPPGYTAALKSSTRRISLVGNAWTVDVIVALLAHAV